MRKANGDLHGYILESRAKRSSSQGFWAAPIVEKSVPRGASDFEVRAVYLTGLMAGSDHGLKIIRRWREVGGNAVVFDIKDSDGSVNIPFENPLAAAKTPRFATCRSLCASCIRRDCTPLRGLRFSATSGW